MTVEADPIETAVARTRLGKEIGGVVIGTNIHQTGRRKRIVSNVSSGPDREANGGVGAQGRRRDLGRTSPRNVDDHVRSSGNVGVRPVSDQEKPGCCAGLSEASDMGAIGVKGERYGTQLGTKLDDDVSD